MSDLISRQAAIGVVKGRFSVPVDNLIVEVIGAIPSAQTWIPCSERLPEEFETVLICESFGLMYVGCVIGKSEDGTPLWKDDSTGHVDLCGYAIAWMPLPEPYKEATNE